ncbi:uncharacterized protein YacL [Flavobacterium aquidurense]|nr:uncharacterized protein YacL [Flavobacterium aquidurense]
MSLAFVRINFIKLKFAKMKKEENSEIIRDNRVTRLLWFTLGFFCALLISFIVKI